MLIDRRVFESFIFRPGAAFHAERTCPQLGSGGIHERQTKPASLPQSEHHGRAINQAAKAIKLRVKAGQAHQCALDRAQSIPGVVWMGAIERSDLCAQGRLV